MKKISQEELEKFKVVLVMLKPSPKVIAVAENCLESFIPFLAKGMHQKSLEAWAFDKNGMRAGIYKLYKGGELDLLELAKKCNRTIHFDKLFTRA